MNQLGLTVDEFGNPQSFFATIGQQLGPDIVHKMKSFASLKTKIDNYERRKRFLTTCRRNRVTPSHIMQNIKCVFQSLERDSPFNKEIENIASMMRRRILNMEIKMCFWRLKKFEKALDDVAKQLSTRLPNHPVLQRFYKTQEDLHRRARANDDRRIEARIHRLQQKRTDNLAGFGKRQFLHNATNVNIPNDVQAFMGLGPRHGLPAHMDRDTAFQYIADVENILEYMDDSREKDVIRSSVVSDLEKYNYRRLSAMDQWLTDTETAVRKFKSNYKNILFVRSDKGNVTVAMDRQDYKQKTDDLILNNETYTEIADPTSRYMKSNRELFKQLYQKRSIDYRTKMLLSTYKAVPPRIYFLPKYHKDGMPLRPIVSTTNTVTYELSKYLAQILAKVPKSEYHVRNSYEFREWVCQLNVPKGWIMVSFDVVSLFTNLPTDLMIEAINGRWNDVKHYTTLNNNEFMALVNIVVHQNYFSYNNKIYQQNSGMPMGCSLSPIGAEFTLDHILDTVIEWVRQTLDANIVHIKKYVDDLFLIIPEHLANEIQAIFNSANFHIEFTIEMERNLCLPFLDVLVVRNEIDGAILTRWYKKPIASGRLLNFYSIHPLAQKMSVLYGFIDRVMRLSSPCFHAEEKVRILEMLGNNGYPRNLVNTVLNKYCERRNSVENVDSREASRYVSMMYIKGISEHASKLVRANTNDLKIAFKSRFNVGLFFDKLKDRIPTELMANVIYQVFCTGGDNKNYVGTTGQFVKNRMSGHRSDCNQQHTMKSALCLHATRWNHSFDFDNVKILAQNDNDDKRKFLEELYIKASRNCVNIKSREAQNVSSIYNHLFSVFEPVD